MSETLQVSGIVAGYIPDLPVLRDVSLSAQKGKITVIIGPNGAGKSTLIKAVSGLVPATEGHVVLNGANITNPRPDQMGGLGVAYIPQTDNVFRSLTIRQNLELVLRNAGPEGPARLDRLFQQFPPLAQKQRERAGSLSGGQRQFLAIAMALAIDPSLILMDEPSAGLSPKAAEEVLEHAHVLAQRGVTILLVEQNVKQALRLADHCYILADGRNQIDGPAADLLSDPVVGQIYLGGKRMAPT
ncbi:ABC transporter ATP-binding protein [uncultured Roseobacter sp.]|uniref:ABC transporter ATP-binding protein n=1 Tax=uncultured Roseobacter sp. TaxID=114847 RepID=UPI0026332DCF|nr:ABC transporter ATP-binding protein [uncultured Roseobacter sp.]